VKCQFIGRGDSHIREPFFPWDYLAQALKIDVDYPTETIQPTIYSMGKNADHPERQRVIEALEKYKDRPVCLVLSHGEIDMRCHFHKFGETLEATRQHMNGMITNYFAYLRDLQRTYPNIKLLVVYGVLPPNPFLLDWMRDPMWGYHRPEFNGRRTDHYICELNKRLEAESKKNGFFYFDVNKYSKEIKKEGFALYSPRSGLQMHLNSSNKTVQSIFKREFKKIIAQLNKKKKK
jgi:hypothetical protein